MAVVLEGGCRVTDMREGPSATAGTLKAWSQVSKATGADSISLRILEFAPGMSPGLRNRASDELLYVLESLEQGGSDSACVAYIDGRSINVESRTGIYVRPGEVFNVNNPGPGVVVFVSSRCPERPAEDFDVVAPLTEPLTFSNTRSPVVLLSERRATTTADRWYRVLVDEEVGCMQVTQFVGSIPPGRAPDHFHNYEEVLFILRGSGRMWAGRTSAPIGPGSCVYLPKGQVHCVENTGEDELRLLGVFYPAGSPAVRYESGH